MRLGQWLQYEGTEEGMRRACHEYEKVLEQDEGNLLVRFLLAQVCGPAPCAMFSFLGLALA